MQRQTTKVDLHSLLRIFIKSENEKFTGSALKLLKLSHQIALWKWPMPPKTVHSAVQYGNLQVACSCKKEIFA